MSRKPPVQIAGPDGSPPSEEPSEPSESTHGSSDRERAERAERLLEAGRVLTSELDLKIVLDRILETARELTGARYAALGVLDDGRHELEQFLTSGMDVTQRAAIGDLPRGHGVLGVLIDHPEPLRLHDVSQHPRSYGFPLGHPPMRSFLGVPIKIRDQAWGHLYLTDKQDAEDFAEHDIETIVLLAQWAAVAIDNARMFGEATDRGYALQRALRLSRTTVEIAAAVGGDTDLQRILELIVKRGRAVVGADSLLIWLRSGDELELAAAAGGARIELGSRMPIRASTAGEALLTGQSVRVTDASQLQVDPARYGLPQTTSALFVPLTHRGRRHGVLVAFDRLGTASSFDSEDQRLLEAFAISAATAVATARSVEDQRLHDSLAAAESERRRWARELHDETLQGLAALKLSLSSALNSEPALARTILEAAVDQLGLDIAGLRRIISDLRPAALDELGLGPALQSLVEQVAEAAELEATTAIELRNERLPTDLETTAYRVAQEALTNVVKHAGASRVSVVAKLGPKALTLTITDDGQGCSGAPTGEGYGLLGMRERAALARGSLQVSPGPTSGTQVTLTLPHS